MVNNKVLIPASSSLRQTKSFEKLEYGSTFKVYIFIYCLYQIRTIQLFRWEEIEEDKYLIYYTHREKQKKPELLKNIFPRDVKFLKFERFR